VPIVIVAPTGPGDPSTGLDGLVGDESLPQAATATAKHTAIPLSKCIVTSPPACRISPGTAAGMTVYSGTPELDHTSDARHPVPWGLGSAGIGACRSFDGHGV
jgi:hypothetical protein